MSIKKVLWGIVGFIALGVGVIGVFLPILPTVPFLFLALFCFANSSEKVHDWFIHTGIYKKHLESYVKGQGMRKSSKVRIMATVTLLMAVGFGLMARKGLYIPCIILGCVWIAHILYFTFKVKTVEM